MLRQDPIGHGGRAFAGRIECDCTRPAGPRANRFVGLSRNRAGAALGRLLERAAVEPGRATVNAVDIDCGVPTHSNRRVDPDARTELEGELVRLVAACLDDVGGAERACQRPAGIEPEAASDPQSADSVRLLASDPQSAAGTAGTCDPSRTVRVWRGFSHQIRSLRLPLGISHLVSPSTGPTGGSSCPTNLRPPNR